MSGMAGLKDKETSVELISHHLDCTEFGILEDFIDVLKQLSTGGYIDKQEVGVDEGGLFIASHVPSMDLTIAT